VINIHDVQLAQMFAARVVGLRAGRIVYDGPPSGLTSLSLTAIYGEEDWSKTIAGEDESGEAPHREIKLDRDRVESL
jgi:phosphonate transport system ATP-binding protein